MEEIRLANTLEWANGAQSELCDFIRWDLKERKVPWLISKDMIITIGSNHVLAFQPLNTTKYILPFLPTFPF